MIWQSIFLKIHIKKLPKSFTSSNLLKQAEHMFSTMHDITGYAWGP